MKEESEVFSANMGEENIKLHHCNDQLVNAVQENYGCLQ
jgi:hypothetical protein